LPEVEQDEVKNLSALRSQAKSVLSQIKNCALVELVQSAKSRDNQNFIRRNINYVTQLDQISKEKRIMVMSTAEVEAKSVKGQPLYCDDPLEQALSKED